MEFLTQLLATTGPQGLVITVIFVLMLLGIKILWETQKEERKARIDAQEKHTEEFKSVAKQMFEVINANTHAMTTHTEVSRELKDRIHELRLTVNS